MISRIKCLVVLVLSLAASGCTESTNAPETSAVESATPAAFNTAGAPTVEFSVPDMMCPQGCGVKTKEILSAQPGAREVMIDYEGKRAVVAVESEKFDVDAAVAAMIDHSFPNTTVQGGAGATTNSESAPAAQ